MGCEVRTISPEKWDTLWRRHKQLITNCPQLRCASIRKKFYKQARNQFSRIENPTEYFKFSANNYRKALDHLLWVEEAYQAVARRLFDLTDRQVSLVFRPPASMEDLPYCDEWGQVLWVQFVLEEASDEAIHLISGNIVLERAGVYHVITVDRIEGDLVSCRLQLDQRWQYFRSINRTYNISVVPFNDDFQIRHSAIEEVDKNNYLKEGLLYEDYVDDEQKPKDARIDFDATSTPELESDLSECNADQREAIKNMIENKCRPKPFILFGPPGTGKTFTLVKAIGQILARDSTATVLITANSNICVDDLAERLISNKLIKSDEIIRIPIQKFDYVIIDEAGHANEPETLIPMTRLRGHNCVILAGDHKQLGPTVWSKAADFGLGISMLERLIETKIYRDNPMGLYRTDLRETYRCDRRIMQFWNVIFYGNKLISRGAATPPELMNSLVDSLGGAFRYPLVFLHVEGKGVRSKNSCSRYNLMEARKCVELLSVLTRFVAPNRIGVIAPFVSQARTIAQMWHNKTLLPAGIISPPTGADRYDHRDTCCCCTPNTVEINTVEAFQGGEKDIIIISTVCTSRKGTDSPFLNDPHRFNVSLSRARQYLIVVGHPAGLSKSWRLYMSYVKSKERIVSQ